MLQRLFLAVGLLVASVQAQTAQAQTAHAQTAPKSKVAPSDTLRINLKFENAPLLSVKEREQITTKIQDEATAVQDEQASDNLAAWWADEAAERLRVVYQDKGYFKVQVDADLEADPANLPIRRVSIIVKVLDAGPEYRLSRIHWKGMTAFSEQQLLDLVPIQPGEIFSRSKVEKGLESVRKLYLSHGYINFTSIPNAEPDAADTRGMALDIDIDEGAAFHWGALEVEGMDDRHKHVLLRAWEGLRGQPFSQAAYDRFFGSFFRPLDRHVIPLEYTNTKLNQREHTVDAYLVLVPDPSLLKKIPPSRLAALLRNKSNLQPRP